MSSIVLWAVHRYSSLDKSCYIQSKFLSNCREISISTLTFYGWSFRTKRKRRSWIKRLKERGLIKQSTLSNKRGSRTKIGVEPHTVKELPALPVRERWQDNMLQLNQDNMLEDGEVVSFGQRAQQQDQQQLQLMQDNIPHNPVYPKQVMSPNRPNVGAPNQGGPLGPEALYQQMGQITSGENNAFGQVRADAQNQHQGMASFHEQLVDVHRKLGILEQEATRLQQAEIGGLKERCRQIEHESVRLDRKWPNVHEQLQKIPELERELRASNQKIANLERKLAERDGSPRATSQQLVEKVALMKEAALSTEQSGQHELIKEIHRIQIWIQSINGGWSSNTLRIIGRVRFQSWRLDVHSCRHSTYRYMPKFRESNPLGLNPVQFNLLGLNQFQINSIQANWINLSPMGLNSSLIQWTPIHSDWIQWTPINLDQFQWVPIQSDWIKSHSIAMDSMQDHLTQISPIPWTPVKCRPVDWVQLGLTPTSPIKCRPVDWVHLGLTPIQPRPVHSISWIHFELIQILVWACGILVQVHKIREI